MTALHKITGYNKAMYQYFGTSLVPRPTDRFRINESRGARARKVFINPMMLSEGELELKLLAQRIAIHSNHYGDAEGIYNAANNMIYNAVKNNLHREAINFGSVPNELMGVARAITKAVRKTSNASPYSIAGFDPFSDDKLVDTEVICASAKSNLATQNLRYNQFAQTNPIGTPNPFTSSVEAAQKKLGDCLKDSHFYKLLNENLEESAHNFTYGYLTNSHINVEGTNTVASKAGVHKELLETLSGFSPFISKKNMFDWAENGIMRQNANAGEQPFTGQETSFAVGLSEANGINGIGELTTLTVTLILGLANLVIGLVASALNKSKKLESEMTTEQKNKLVFASLNTSAYTPSGTDWNLNTLVGDGGVSSGGGNDGSQTPNSEGSSNNIALFGLGALGLSYLATRK